MPGAAGKEEEMLGTAVKDAGEGGGEEEKNPTDLVTWSLEAVLPMRWRVSYTTNIISRKKTKGMGMILLRAEMNRIVLFDTEERVIDARPLREGELIYPGYVLCLPCHTVDVGECIFQPDACIKEDVLAPSRAIQHQLPSNDNYAIFKEDGEGHLLGNADEIGVEKDEKKRTKKDEKKRRRLKLQEEQEIRHEKKRKLEEEQEMRDEKKRKRLKDAAMRKRKIPEDSSELAEELRRKNRDSIKKIKKEKQTVRSPGVKMVRSPLAMFAKVASLRKEMSPQANLSGSARRPRKLKSKIWKEVIPIYKDGQLVQGQCKHCNDIFAASRKC